MSLDTLDYNTRFISFQSFSYFLILSFTPFSPLLLSLYLSISSHSGTLFHDSEQISVDEVHANDVISLEIDLTTNRIIFFCNGKLQGSGFRNIPRKVRIGVCGYGSTKFNVHFFGSIKKLSPTRSQLDALRWQSW